ncbi:2-oxo acid dehydrogenase subunit E2 [Amycolatopsis sp. EV170708-02-1]|uniref:2-oxo acid dehydrogenase subunit E2 n=1 Tax=Amycolatopsis sp. EV170708-02-1 TaxID=2919322 RepID=UPI001F0CBE0C|nr:2-oxo acid dehydrogenase subunit E2 [Amycolatopsis sp. EV170708-02-1]UMP06805.1 2-oxo acid dehydrogenase subunit E2 [Amycolatopsis sp. EV170708-02-1]
MTTIRSLPAARRHTWHFLRFVRTASPVYLDTEVDATRLLAHKHAANRRYSVVSYVMHGVSRAVAECPEANAACAGGLRPRIVNRESVDVKLALDKGIAGRRAVLSVVVPDCDLMSLDAIQDTVDRLRDTAGEEIPELRGARVLQRLPLPVGRVAFGWANRLRSRHRRMGTVAVTSLGHRPVTRFFSSGGTTLTFGLGRITDRPAVRERKLCVMPILPVSLTFDHRVIDGAAAADVLGNLKDRLETLTSRNAGGPIP